MSTYLDAETVENILSHRPVYLAIREEFCYEHTKHENLAIEFSFEKAALQAHQVGLNGLHEEAYVPKKRWYLTKFEGWRDHTVWWEDCWLLRRIDECKVEQWLPGRGRADVRYFDFDNWFKRRIMSSKMSPAEIDKQLISWRDALSNDNLPEELLQQMHASIERFEKIDDRQAWVEHYGSEAPWYSETVDPSLAPSDTYGKTRIPV